MLLLNFICLSLLLALILEHSSSLSSAAAVAGQHRRQRRRTPVNLYDKDPQLVAALDVTTFDGIVYNSSEATCVEFYAHWCGACRKLKPRILDLARDTQRWHRNRIMRVAAVNCGDSFNEELCMHHEIGSYPTMRLFAPHSKPKRHGHGMQVG